MTWKSGIVAVLLGMLGMAALQGARHLYYDHLNIHNLTRWVTQVQEAQKQARPQP